MKIKLHEQDLASESKLQRVDIRPVAGITGPVLGEALHHGIPLSGSSHFQIWANDGALQDRIVSADHWSTMEEAVKAMAAGFLVKEDPKIQAYVRELIKAERVEEV